MLLTKIMMKKPEEVQTVLTSKLALKYAGEQVRTVCRASFELKRCVWLDRSRRCALWRQRVVRARCTTLRKPKQSFRLVSARSLARSLAAVVCSLRAVLKNNQIVQTQLTMLYGELLEQHLLRYVRRRPSVLTLCFSCCSFCVGGSIVEPYSRIELARVAELMKLDVATVEKHLAHMILEQKLKGILDQVGQRVWRPA